MSEYDRMPPPPRPVKLWGVATTIDGVPAVYTEADLLRYGAENYRLGYAAGRTAPDRQMQLAQEAAREAEDYRRRTGCEPRD